MGSGMNQMNAGNSYTSISYTQPLSSCSLGREDTLEGRPVSGLDMSVLQFVTLAIVGQERDDPYELTDLLLPEWSTVVSPPHPCS